MDAKPFKCEDCDKEYGYLWQLNQHRVAHSDERKFVCECCAKSYKTMKHLRQHWHHYPRHRK
jgi:KRAB domain-containing zinc finger protein